MRYLRPMLLAALAVAVAACSDQNTNPVTPQDAGAPNATIAASANGQVIKDSYIVVLKGGADPGSVAAAAGVTPRHIYSIINGFAGTLNAGQLNALQRNTQVEYIEADQVMRAFTEQLNATWGLDRIDQRALPLSGTYSYTSDGTGVTAYIIDTGIDYAHTEFGGRATFGYDAMLDGAVQKGDDCNGHGTHVSGTVGGTTYGVAKKVKFVAVRVLDCTGAGSTSGVIAGVDWVTKNHVKPAVANMSLGGGASSSLDQAVNNSINAGVSYAIAAGNGDTFGNAQDACQSSPARVAAAMTIGASDKSDAKTSWSNYGNCVDWFAPGAGITSAWIGALNSETNTISGTSMATPHVAGVAALYLQSNPAASPQQVRDALYNATTKGIVTKSNTTNNHLLYSLFDGNGGGSSSPADNISLAAASRKSGKTYYVDLSWSGSSASNVDIFRNGALLTTTANDGAQSDKLGSSPSGTYTYKVCNAGTNTCSNEASVTF